MAEVQYDSSVIQTFAQRLYARAASIVVTHTLVGFLGGLVAGFAGLQVLGVKEPLLGVAVCLLGVLIGYRMGSDKAFVLKLQAQTALCQMHIEANTRLSRVHTPPPVPRAVGTPLRG
jgi:hypothetical protein